MVFHERERNNESNKLNYELSTILIIHTFAMIFEHRSFYIKTISQLKKDKHGNHKNKH